MRSAISQQTHVCTRDCAHTRLQTQIITGYPQSRTCVRRSHAHMHVQNYTHVQRPATRTCTPARASRRLATHESCSSTDGKRVRTHICRVLSTHTRAYRAHEHESHWEHSIARVARGGSHLHRDECRSNPPYTLPNPLKTPFVFQPLTRASRTQPSVLNLPRSRISVIAIAIARIRQCYCIMTKYLMLSEIIDTME